MFILVIEAIVLCAMFSVMVYIMSRNYSEPPLFKDEIRVT